MSDTITKWHEMQEENGLPINHVSKGKINEAQHKDYIWVLDFTDGKVYSYKVPNGVNDLESFIIGAGHKLNSVEWKNTNECEVEYGN